MACGSGVIAYSLLNQSSPSQAVSFKAAIIDQESLTFPNQTFVQTVTNLLKQGGYTIHYYPGPEITVDLYKSLPTDNYGLIILRVHSGVSALGRIDFFSNENYSGSSHIYEQLSDQVSRGSYAEGPPYFFAISPLFVRQSMKGTFHHTVIIVMGCKGLAHESMAQAFVSKGASVYVSWDESVTPSRTDTAIMILLRSLAQGNTIRQAVSVAMGEAGPDPIYNSQLGYYPQDQGGLVLSPSHTGMMPSVQTAEASVRSSLAARVRSAAIVRA